MPARRKGDFTLTFLQQQTWDMYQSGMSVYKIAEELGVGDSVISKRIVQVRKLLEAQRVAEQAQTKLASSSPSPCQDA